MGILKNVHLLECALNACFKEGNHYIGDITLNLMLDQKKKKKTDLFVKYECPRQQQSQNELFLV